MKKIQAHAHEVDPPHPMTSEQQFVVLCANVYPDENTQKKIILIAENHTLDWNLVFDYAVQQKVWLLVYQNIKSFVPDMIPEEISKKFKNSYISNASRNMQLTVSLLKIVGLFHSHQIEILPFKGPVLSQTVYENIGLRFFSDLDILIKIEDSIKAWKLLEENGLEPVLKLTDPQKHKYIETEDHMAFVKGFLHVELHWEITGMYLYKPIRFNHIGKKGIITNVLGQDLMSLSLEKLLLYLCIHGSKDNWASLEQICSINELIKKESLDWRLIDQLAVDWRCQNILLIGLYLCWDIFKTPLPESILLKVENNNKISKLGKTIKTKLFRVSHNSGFKTIPERFSFYHISIRDSYPQKLLYVIRLVFSPTEKEWRYFPVPGKLSFIHYFLRPLRLLTAVFWKRYA